MFDAIHLEDKPRNYLLLILTPRGFCQELFTDKKAAALRFFSLVMAFANAPGYDVTPFCDEGDKVTDCSMCLVAVSIILNLEPQDVDLEQIR